MTFTRLAFLSLLVPVLFGQDISGSYRGAIKVEAGADSRVVEGVIIIKENNGTVTVSAGPDSGEQYPAESVQRDGNRLKVVILAGSERPRKLTFDFTVNDSMLSGTGTLERDGQTQTGKLEFKKQ
jgi:hypothetical protein